MRGIGVAVLVLALAAGVGGGAVPRGAGPVGLPSAGPAGEPGEGVAPARATGHPGAYAAALGQAAVVPVSPLASLHGWEERGPTGVGGRLTDLALAPDGTVYAAAASGGLWASDDGGATLRAAWPSEATPAIGAVAVTADGAALVGTGEANGGGGSLTYGGAGVWRSTDRGVTWTHVGLETSGTVADIEPHPTDPDVVWLAAGGDLFTAGGQRGIYRSPDGGLTWQQVLAPATATTGGADIAVDPSDPDHLLAATWDRQRTPSLRRYGGPGSGLHVSRDGGSTWAPVAGGLPGFTDDAGRIAVAFSPADPSRVYAVVTRGDGRAGGLWRSDDSGTTWQRVDHDPIYEPTQFIFAWWFGRVFPAPDDPDRVLVPGLSLLESTDGGVTFRTDARVHADQHDLVWDPADPARAWLATDGGMYASTDGGRPLTWTATRNQPFTQVYDVAVPPGDPDAVVAGFQDVGCLVTAGDTQPADGWRRTASCGDGTRVLAHPDRPSDVVVCGQYGRCRRSADLGATTGAVQTPDDGRAAWAAPLIRVPGQPDVLLFGGARVHRSDDGGDSWTALSPDLTRGASPDPDYPFGTVTALAAGPGGRLLAAGTDDGLVWRSADAGATWHVVADQDRWVTSLAVAGDALVIGTSGYRSGVASPQVLLAPPDEPVRPIGAGLPEAPVNDLAVIEGPPGTTTAVVAATDVGVYLAADLHQPVWRRVGPDLPQAPVTALDWLPDARQLTIGTYGRGVWRTRIPDVVRHGGGDRYVTAAAIVRSQPLEGVDTVLLASGEAFSDALSAAVVAAGRPATRLVLARRDSLPAPTAALLADIGPSRILVVGGPAAVGQDVVEAALDVVPGATASRLAGADRYGTAVAVADHLAGGAADHPTGQSGGTVVLATAGAAFDALAGAPYAAGAHAPVLLVDPDRVPEATAEALGRLRPTTVVALGGAAAISDAVLADAAAISRAETTRLAGDSRIGTAAVLAAAQGPGTGVWLAGATTFADALVAAASGHPVLLVDGDRLAPETSQALQHRRPLHVWIAGGDAVVPDAVADQLQLG